MLGSDSTQYVLCTIHMPLVVKMGVKPFGAGSVFVYGELRWTTKNSKSVQYSADANIYITMLRGHTMSTTKYLPVSVFCNI